MAFLPLNFLIAETQTLSLSKLNVLKRNKPSCTRIGNVYDACQWMVKFTLTNNTDRDLKSFCSIIKINNKKYEICSGKKREGYFLKANKSRIVLSNLSELINYENDNPKPKVRFISINAEFAK